ncbi:MAG: precorrin-8X/cobalt-precorrin-8 methylmutase [Actinomycetota bacterium]|nr:precorrin-8X/cobalt-precorrin-8 methylmutase [Actinomycetota bacterium]
MTVAVASSCTACGACLATCPERALVPAPRRPAVLDSLCTDCLACLEVCPVDAIIPVPEPPPEPATEVAVPAPAGFPVHPIEEASYRILAGRVDLSAWPDGARDVVARMVHATADESFAGTARIGEQAVEAAVAALVAGAPVVCDARMVLAGLPSVSGAVCYLDQVADAAPGDTRSAGAIRIAAEWHPDGALWVIGNAPTALFALLNLYASGAVRPAAIVGLPVGYVGAAESKAALWAGNLRPLAITNVGVRGGSPAAAGAVNALARLAAARRGAGAPAPRAGGST